MARGLVAGGIFFSTLALTCALLTQFGGSQLQSWMVQRTEVYDKVCVRGTGVYTVGSVWGDDIPGLKNQTRGKCENGRYRTEMSTSDAFCRGGDPNSAYDTDMCIRTIIAKSSAFLAILFHVGAICAGLFCHSVDTVNDEVLPALMAAVFAMAASLTSWGVFITMSTSRLFSDEHIQELSEESHLLVPYKGIGCVFQEPFVSPWWVVLMFYNWPQECVLFGYGYILSVCEACFSFLGSLIMFLLVRDLRGLRIKQDAEKRPATSSFLQESREAITASGVEVEDEGGEDLTNESLSRRRSGSDMGSTGSLPPRDHYYSLYGAFHRHLGLEYGWLTRRVIATIAPILVLGDLGLAVAWMMSGVRFTMNVRVNSPVIRENFAYEVFDFNSVTSVTDLWNGGAHLMSILTFMATFFVPIMKCFVWIYFWYLPFDEILRGQILAWIDSLGKVALANIFCLVLMAVGFLFDTELLIPVVLFTVKVRIVVAINTGFIGTWGQVLASVISLCLGQWFVYFHGRAARWENIRHRGDHAKLKRSVSLFRIMDTPFLFDSEWTHQESSYRVISPFFGPESNTSNTQSNVDQLVSPVLFNESDDIDRGASDLVDNEDISAPMLRMRRSTSLSTAGDDRQATPVALCETVFKRPIPVEVEERRSSRLVEDTVESSREATPFFKDYVFSTGAKLCIDMLLIVLLLLMIVGLQLHICLFRHKGVVSEGLLPKDVRVEGFSVPDMITSIYYKGMHGPVVALSGTMLLFVVVFPVLHVVGLMVLWRFPLRTVRNEETLFRFVEMFAAWNSIDIFVICVAVTSSDIGVVASTVIPQIVPTLTSTVNHIFPQDVLYSSEPSFRDGFWVLIAATVLEKLLTFLLMPLFATRIAQQKLENIKRHVGPNHAGGSNHLEHHQVLEILSPTARYVSNPTAAATGVVPSLLWSILVALHIFIPASSLPPSSWRLNESS